MPESVVAEAETFRSIPDHTVMSVSAVEDTPAPAVPENVTSSDATPAVSTRAVVAKRTFFMLFPRVCFRFRLANERIVARMCYVSPHLRLNCKRLNSDAKTQMQI